MGHLYIWADFLLASIFLLLTSRYTTPTRMEDFFRITPFNMELYYLLGAHTKITKPLFQLNTILKLHLLHLFTLQLHFQHNFSYTLKVELIFLPIFNKM